MNKIVILFIIFILLIAATTCAYFDPFAAAGVPSLFWQDTGKQIYRMPAYDTEEVLDFYLEPEPPGFWDVTAMAFEPIAGMMYLGIVTDTETGTGIYRAHYNGRNVEKIISTSMDVQGIAIDYYTREIFWSEATIIRKANLEELEKNIQVFDTEVYITDLEVDMVSHRLYYVDGSGSFYFIYTDGGPETSISLTIAGSMAGKIELSAFDNKIFWLNEADMSIYHSDINSGENGVQLSPSNLPGVIDFSLDLETGHMFWADSRGIFQIRTDGAFAEQLIINSMNIHRFAGDFMNAKHY